jgi:hypothetical protein
MKSYQKHLKEKRNSLLFVFLLLILVGCGKKETKEEYVARVNKVVLTESRLDSLMFDNKYKNKFQEEIIREWVESEILFQQAVELDFDKNSDYRNLVELAKKEIAVAYLLNRVINNTPIDYGNYDIENYFWENKKDYILKDDAYSLNIAVFTEQAKAFDFRKETLKSNWNYAASLFEKESSLTEIQTKTLYYNYEIQPIKRLRVIKNQAKDEIGIVLEEEPGRFVVVQVVDKFYKKEIPSFEYVENIVIERYLREKKHELFQEYLDNLYSKYDVEIK